MFSLCELTFLKEEMPLPAPTQIICLRLETSPNHRAVASQTCPKPLLSKSIPPHLATVSSHLNSGFSNVLGLVGRVSSTLIKVLVGGTLATCPIFLI